MRLSLSLTLALLAATGGCAESYSAPETPGCRESVPAVVPTSSDMAPRVGEVVTLGAKTANVPASGECVAQSSDFTYSWLLTSVPAGSHASLNATTVDAPSFVVDAAGTYVARVLAVDSTGHAGKPAELRIEAGSCGANAPVVGLLSSAPATPASGDTVTLGASVTDADTDGTCSAHAASFAYTWSFTDLPPGSHSALNDTHVEHPSFVADTAGTYALDLVVTDPTGRAGTASVSVDVAATNTSGPDDGGDDPDCGSAAPVAAAWKVAPGSVMDCSVPLIPTDLEGGDQIMLDAVPSSDADTLCGQNQSLDYHWTLLATPIDGASSQLLATGSRTTVLQVTSEGEYQLRLVVTDSTGRASPELVCALYAYGLK
jgi:hypothetical protein